MCLQRQEKHTEALTFPLDHQAFDSTRVERASTKTTMSGS